MNYKELSEQELIDLFISGDETCIKELFRRHKSRVYTYIMLIVKERELAEDIFQETFIKVIKSLRKGRYMDKGMFLLSSTITENLSTLKLLPPTRAMPTYSTAANLQRATLRMQWCRAV